MSNGIIVNKCLNIKVYCLILKYLSTHKTSLEPQCLLNLTQKLKQIGSRTTCVMSLHSHYEQCKVL